MGGPPSPGVNAKVIRLGLRYSIESSLVLSLLPVQIALSEHGWVRGNAACLQRPLQARSAATPSRACSGWRGEQAAESKRRRSHYPDARAMGLDPIYCPTTTGTTQLFFASSFRAKLLWNHVLENQRYATGARGSPQSGPEISR